MSSSASDFGFFRSFLWPIYPEEKKKLLPMLLMICLILFSYDLLRNMKDTVLVTAAGAEVIPFVTVWVLLPGAVLMTLFFTKLTNHYSFEQIFYIIISSFLLFFLVFAFLIYPLRESLHADRVADFLQGVLPKGFKGLVEVIRHWTFAIFYVMAELWGTFVMTVLFWGFANQITHIFQAHRFYAVFCTWSHCSGIVAGRVAGFLPRENDKNWGTSLIVLVLLISVAGLLVMGIYRWINKNVIDNQKIVIPKKGLSLYESFSALFESKYLLGVATIVVSYNLFINMVDVIWKDQLRVICPNPGDYYAYMSNVTTMIGIISTCTSISMAVLIKRFGWTFTALITPIVMCITTMMFFGFFIFHQYYEDTFIFLGVNSLVIAVFIGAIQNSLSKGMKYSLFDGTKEMAFIPLSDEVKIKGKAAIDGVGSRMGKSGGSLLHTVLLMIFGSISTSTPYVALILLFVIFFWIKATFSIGNQYSQINLPTPAVAQTTV